MTWYCVSRGGLATLCADEKDARAVAQWSDRAWPQHAPHAAVLLGNVAAERERCAELCDSLAFVGAYERPGVLGRHRRVFPRYQELEVKPRTPGMLVLPDIDHAQTAWADLPALSPVRRVEPGAVLTDEQCERVFRDSQAAALVPGALAYRQQRRVEPYAIGAALALLSILGAGAIGLAAWLAKVLA